MTVREFIIYFLDHLNDSKSKAMMEILDRQLISYDEARALLMDYEEVSHEF